jgi:signal recognition particle subunit SRP54
MQGQDAVNTAKAFKDALPLTGVVLTKLDGDSRGGAALSVRQITGAPIKFAGVSEKIDGLEVFDAERHAGRVLGMGDIVALVEEVQKGVDLQAAQKLADKVKSGSAFDLNDFLSQISADEEDGRPVQPDGQAAQPAHRQSPGRRHGQGRTRREAHGRHHQFDDAAGAPQARTHQGQPQAPHRHGAGVHVQEVNRLLNQFEQMQGMMKKMKGGGLMKMMKRMGGMGGGGFPGMPR